MTTNKYELFYKLLQENKIYEERAGEKICKLNNTTILRYNNDYKYDFITSDNIMYEIKADHKAIKTGNFFIEYIGNSKPSGIAVSIANYYILTDTKYYFMLQTDVLKLLCRGKYSAKTPDNSSIGFLVSRYDIIKNSVII